MLKTLETAGMIRGIMLGFSILGGIGLTLSGIWNHNIWVILVGIVCWVNVIALIEQ